MVSSLLLLGSLVFLGFVGSPIIASNKGYVLSLHIMLLVLIVELSSAIDSFAGLIVIQGMGFVSVILLAISLWISRSFPSNVHRNGLSAGFRKEQMKWGIFLAVPLLLLLSLRLVDTRSLSSFYLKDVQVFLGSEDNAKWLGAASDLISGKSVGVEAIGGFLIVLLRVLISVAHVLAFLGVRSLRAEFMVVTFSSQLARELLVALTPLIFLLVGTKETSFRKRFRWITPSLVLYLIAQLIAFENGFLSLQASLGLGALYVLLRTHEKHDDALHELVIFLVGLAFLLSWLPLRMLLPLFVAMNINHLGVKHRSIIRIFSVLIAVFCVLPSYRYVLGFYPGRPTGLAYALNLLEAGGNVIGIEHWLVLLVAVIVACAVLTEPKTSQLRIFEKAFFGYVIVVIVADVVLEQQLGYGSSKLFFLTLILVSVWASTVAINFQSSVNVQKCLTFLAASLMFMVAVSNGPFWNLWASHVQGILGRNSPTTVTRIRDRLNDPIVNFVDFGNLHDVLQKAKICSQYSCDLRDLPQYCLVIYTSQRLISNPRPYDAMSAAPFQTYQCSRFLSEMSQGSIARSDFQKRFFFASGEHLRDALVDVASESPETRFLVAIEDKISLEVLTASELRVIARQTYPQSPSCNYLGYLETPRKNCSR